MHASGGTASNLTTASIPHLIKSLAIPSGTGFFFTTMFNIVDTWYAGRISTYALAAMSLCFPLFFILLSFGSGVSSGATALVGHALGRSEHDDAQFMAAQSLSFAILHAICLAAFGVMLSRSMLTVVGGEGETLRLATGYIDIIFAGSPFFLMNFVISAILNAHGDTRSYRNVLIAGFFLNLVMDPWFMYGGLGMPSMGLPGIALATVLIQCAGTVYLLAKLKTSSLLGPAAFSDMVPRWKEFRELFRLGFPSMLNMLSVSTGIFIITAFASRFGSSAVAAYGIGSRIEQVALLPIMGLNISTIALSAQNLGAKRIDRIREVLRVSIRYGIILSALGTVAVFLAAREAVALFSSDPAVIEEGIRFLRIEALIFPAYMIIYISVSCLQGIQKPGFTLVLGAFRQILLPAPLFYLFSHLLGKGISSIWWSTFAITWSAALLALLYTKKILQSIEQEQAAG